MEGQGVEGEPASSADRASEPEAEEIPRSLVRSGKVSFINESTDVAVKAYTAPFLVLRANS